MERRGGADELEPSPPKNARICPNPTGAPFDALIIYLATREVFLQHVREQRIEEEVRERYIAITGHKVAANEFRAWQNSLQCVGNVLQFKEIPRELGVAIEFKIHNTAKRIDLLLSGRNANGAPAAVIVELKQWETVEPTELDGVVRTFLGKGPRETTHPSYQAMSYRALLRGFNTAVVEHGIELQPCAYLHNCLDGRGLTDARYGPIWSRRRCSCATTTPPWRPSCAAALKWATKAARLSGSVTARPSPASSWRIPWSGCSRATVILC